MNVHVETLKEVEPYTYIHKGVTHSVPQYTIEVTIREDRRIVSCAPHGDDICIRDLAIRFSSGAKVWPGTAWYFGKTGNVGMVRPNIDKSGHFILSGFFEDHYGKKHASQHNAVV